MLLDAPFLSHVLNSCNFINKVQLKNVYKSTMMKKLLKPDTKSICNEENKCSQNLKNKLITTKNVLAITKQSTI